jgi:hypothetical protein
MWMKQSISEQRKALISLFKPAMLNLSKTCVMVWTNLDRLDKVLSAHFRSIPHCHLIYAVDKFGKQMSSNISVDGIDSNYRDQDLSRRPYCVSLYPKRHFMLSSVYISQTTGHPCISAVQPVIDDQQFFLGFVVADFDLHQLPSLITPPQRTAFEANSHYQIAHKPSQTIRVSSRFDNYFTDIIGILKKLIYEYGVFHCTLHYASANVQLWHKDDPYQYHLYEVEQLRDPNLYLTYSSHAYPENAKVSLKNVQQVLERFRLLRFIDENIYLRSSSLNIMNGMVSLSFSFDGSRYLTVEQFLNQDIAYWLGQAAVNNPKYQHWNKEKNHLPIGKYFDNSFFNFQTK